MSVERHWFSADYYVASFSRWLAYAIFIAAIIARFSSLRHAFERLRAAAIFYDAFSRWPPLRFQLHATATLISIRSPLTIAVTPYAIRRYADAYNAIVTDILIHIFYNTMHNNVNALALPMPCLLTPLTEQSALRLLRFFRHAAG